jgi:hypothetical protein
MSTGSIGHKQGVIEICRKSPNEAQQRPIPSDMNMVELDGKKVLVRPSQAESTKGKEVVIGDERPPRMIKVKSLKDGQW